MMGSLLDDMGFCSLLNAVRGHIYSYLDPRHWDLSGYSCFIDNRSRLIFIFDTMITFFSSVRVRQRYLVFIHTCER